MKVSPNGQGPVNYNDGLQKVCTIKDSSDLSYVLRHLKPLSDMETCNVNIFKEGVPPVWEHPSNANGCSWTIQFKLAHANVIFEHIIIYLCLVKFKKISCNGIKLNVRGKYVRFEIWSEDIPLVLEGQEALEELRAALGLDFAVDFLFKSHKELITRVVKPQLPKSLA